SMRVLVVGSGGREHALTWKLLQSSLVDQLFVAPGNAGTCSFGTNLPVNDSDIPGLVAAAKDVRSDLVVVGPEVPLALGIVDALNDTGVPVFGPSKAAARLESSKSFAHDLMDRHGIASAASRTFTSLRDAREFVEGLTPPIVIKADGLAAGKGSILADSAQEAHAALQSMMQERVFGEAGDRVVIEEYLEGREVSLLAFTDGRSVVPMVPACDYKRARDNDEGPNTGGMGCYSPPGFFGPEMVERATREVLVPTVSALRNEGLDFRGVIYAGLMVKGDDMKVLEFNARFGDPETQIVLPLMQSDLARVLLDCAEARLDPSTVEFTPGCSVGVVLASGGYPGPYKKGIPISGLDNVDADVTVFHAGTTMRDGNVVTNGGRVMAVVATGATLGEARERVYAQVPRISFEGMMYRADIALREVV
ncbi:MAG: phosphoribosylamine--glycine ligase, partial [Chloroflexota bacterium]